MSGTLLVFLYLSLAAARAQASPLNPEETQLAQLVAAIAHSGRVLAAGESHAERLDRGERLAPGAPPLVSFRYFEGKEKHRFADLDLVMDDAGH